MKYQIFILILEKIKNNKFTYELNRVISDLFLALFNNFDINKTINKFKSDINNKNIKILKNIDFEKIDDIKINKIIHNEKIINDNTIVIYEFIYNNTLSVKYSKKIPNTILNKLKINEIYPKLILKYSMIGFDTGHFWGLHPKIYRYIKRKYKNPLECFASPFNHNLNKYYSLFPSIDKYYGSIGNFFEDFMKADNDIFVINPPFVEDIMNKVFNYILKKSSSNPNCDFFIYIPAWDDIVLPWLNKQKEIRKTYLCNIKKYQSIVYDYINHKSIESTFDTYIIYITNSNNNVNNLCNLQRK